MARNEGIAERALWFAMSFPGDQRLLDTLRDVAAKLAQCAGHGAPDAQSIASAVTSAAAFLMEALPPAGGRVEVDFSVESRSMDVVVSCHGGEDGTPVELSTKAIEAELRREGVDSVHFGRADGWPFCRIGKQLPGAA
jgi:hypothetical protein